jgi:hypothetical protein
MSAERVDQAGLLAEHRPDLEHGPAKNISPAGQEIKNSSYKKSASKNTERKMKRFLTACSNIPATGRGCHPALLGVANLGVDAGLDDTEIFNNIRSKIPPGSRVVPDEEIWQAIAKARNQPTPALRQTLNRQLPIVHKMKKKEFAQATLQAIIEHGGHVDLDELYRHSPVPLSDTEPHMITLLKNLYSPDSLIFIGRRTDPGVVGDSIRKASVWVNFFQEQCAKTRTPAEAAYFAEEFPHIMANPLSGLQKNTKTGKNTFRGDECIQDFRFAVGEFDVLSVDNQLSFWRGLGLPVCALIHSGGKSIHAWLRVDCVNNSEDWTRVIEMGMFPMLGSLGVDTACKNESRLSRLPGMFRTEKNQFQRLLWLCPEGGVI